MATRSKSQKSSPGGSTHHPPAPQHTEIPHPPQANGGDCLKSARLTRLDEKNTLIGLNNRLAAIIQNNHQLQIENSQLSLQVESAEESLRVATKTISESVRKENGEIRKQLLDALNEKAKTELNLENLKKSLNEFTQRTHQVQEELKSTIASRNAIQEELRGTKAELEKEKSERLKSEGNQKKLEGKHEKLLNDFQKLKKETEVLSIGKDQLQHQVASLQQELNSKEELHQSEVCAISTKNLERIEQVGNKLGQDYEASLQKMVHNLRGEYEAQLLRNKTEMDTLFKLKETDWAKQKDKLNGELKETRGAMAKSESALDIINGTLKGLEKENQKLLEKLKEVEEKLGLEMKSNGIKISTLERELVDMESGKNALMIDYGELMGIKVALDNEISTYRSLLDGEEQRLNSIFNQEAAGDGNRRSSRKRTWNSSTSFSAVATTITK